MLKLYHGRPVMINKNKDVKNCIANGAMGKFAGVELARGVTLDDLEIIEVDGYFVRAASVAQISCIKIDMSDGDQRRVSLVAEKITANCSFPMALFGPVEEGPLRVWRKISFTQLGVGLGLARAARPHAGS